VQVRFLYGPAGSGKTFRCLSEIRAALQASPDGPALILLAPKQATFQLERQLLADDSLRGYTRLRILSFERLADFIFEELRQPPPRMLDEEGRLMVLRAVLAKKRDQLKLFRASARLTGFARQLSLVLRELQSNQITPDALRNFAADTGDSGGLRLKLHDLALLLENYLGWLQAHELQDVDCLMAAATGVLKSQTGKRKLETYGWTALRNYPPRNWICSRPWSRIAGRPRWLFVLIRKPGPIRGFPIGRRCERPSRNAAGA